MCTALATDGSPRVSITGAREDGALRAREADEALAAAFVADALRDLRRPPDGAGGGPLRELGLSMHLVGVLARRRVALAKGAEPSVAVFGRLPSASGKLV